MPDRIAFRPGPLSDALTARADDASDAAASRIAQRDLGRYYEMLAGALASVGLSEEEALFLVDILNGTYIELMTAQMLPYEAEDAEPSYFEKWGIDRAVLLKKLHALTLAQRLAVCDAVERAWGNQYHQDDMRARVVRVGLVRAK